MAGRVRWQGAEPVYRLVIGFVLLLFKVMDWRVRIHGAEHVPSSGPAVLASNHIGYLDFVFVGFGARERGRLVRFMAKKEVFDHRVSGPLMRAMKHVPVDRYGDPQLALDESVRRLGRGEVIGMFPEGTISPSFVPRDGKTGTVRMAMQAGAPVIPCAVWGTQRILTKWRPRNFQRHVAIDVHYGPPVAYAPDDDPVDVTLRLMAEIRRLVDVAAAAYPQEPAGPDDSWWLPAHLGGTAPTPEAAEERLRAQREQQTRVRQERDAS